MTREGLQTISTPPARPSTRPAGVTRSGHSKEVPRIEGQPRRRGLTLRIGTCLRNRDRWRSKLKG
jgi:hypothetical protein